MICIRPHLLLCIRLFVESRKQEIEKDSMSSNEVGEIDWIVAVIFNEQLEGVNHHQHELHHLKNSQVFFPPQILLHFWSHRGEHIVRVHHNVDKCIQEAKERTVTARREFNAPPNGNGHNSMVNDMQCGHLIISFSHYEEDCVKEFCEF